MTRVRTDLPEPGVKPSSAPTAPIGDQTNHTEELELGGQGTEKKRRRRTPRLRVVSPLQLPADFEILPGVPRTRGDCKDGPRPCPYIACRHHLWLRLQEEQPGNPQRGRQGPTTFRPSTMQSCALDVAEQAVAFDVIGDHLGVDPTRARQIAQEGLEKLKASHPELAAELEARLG